MQSLLYGDVVIKIQRAPNHDGYFVSREDVHALEKAQAREKAMELFHPGGNVGAALNAIANRVRDYNTKGDRIISNEDYEGFRLMVKLAYDQMDNLYKRFNECSKLLEKSYSANRELQDRMTEMKGTNYAFEFEAMRDKLTAVLQYATDRTDINSTFSLESCWDAIDDAEACIRNSVISEFVEQDKRNQALGTNQYPTMAVTKEMLEASKDTGDAFVYAGGGARYDQPVRLGPSALTPMEKMETGMDLMAENLITSSQAKGLLALADEAEKTLNAPKTGMALQLKKDAREAMEKKIADIKTDIARNMRLMANPKCGLPTRDEAYSDLKLTDDGSGYEFLLPSWVEMRPEANFLITNLVGDGDPVVLQYIGDRKNAPPPVACGSDGDGGHKSCDCGGAKAKTTHSDWCSTRC